jgi:hypothetical protein
MKKLNVKSGQKSTLIKGAERTLTKAADIFVTPLCCGFIYEVKIPQKLVK